MSRIRKNNKKGSAILSAIGMGVILTIIIVGVNMFSSHRMKVVAKEGKRTKALASAETGLEMILGELNKNSNFATHDLNPDHSWNNAQNYKVSMPTTCNKSEYGFSINNTTSGTYSGKIGEQEFKVRVGNIPYKDNKNTKAVDESKAYLKVESLGKYNDTYRRVEAHINRRFPAREFLMYDGDVCSLVFGKRNDNKTNTFAVGHLYGHKGIEIGKVTKLNHSGSYSGTDQRLKKMTAIMSGDGGIYFYSDIKVEFIDKKTGNSTNVTFAKNTDYPTGGEYDGEEKYGGFPKALKENLPPIPENLKEWVKDKRDGLTLTPKNPDFKNYKELAESSEGMMITSSNNSDKIVSYAMPTHWLENNATSLDAVYLDFGSNLHEGNITQSNFPKNGYIYSDHDIVIKGNPPATVCIVSEKNIFIAGDFNQSAGKDTTNNIYGFPQKYKNSPLDDEDYDESIVEELIKDAEKENASERYHQCATVVAKERIVYDYRNPMDCFENELFPFIKHKLAEKLSDSDTAKKVLNKGKDYNIKISAADQTALETSIDEFFTTYKLNDTAKDVIKTDIVAKYNENESHEINFDNFHEITKKIWTEYSKEYDGGDEKKKGSIKHSSKDEIGIYKFLDDLRAKCGNGTKNIGDDYLYYPEVTVDGMLISCGKRNNTFYSGPDEAKFYNKIGNTESPCSSNIGRAHSPDLTFIHRMYGSEINMRTNDVHRIENGPNNFQYGPPTRRKIYDASLPTLGLEDSQIELAGFIVISWTDTAATEDDWNGF